jgi:hypothetical protein
MATKAAGSTSEAVRQKTAARAYEIWESVGRPHGYDREHWVQAEAEILAKAKKPAAKKATAAIAKGTPRTVTATATAAAMEAGASAPPKAKKARARKK